MMLIACVFVLDFILFQFSFLYLGGVFNETILVALVWSLCLGMGEVNLTVVFTCSYFGVANL